MTNPYAIVPSRELFSRIAGPMGWVGGADVPRELNTEQVDGILRGLPEPERHTFWAQFRGELKDFQGRAVAKAAAAERERKQSEPQKVWKFGP
jgi:hypothetical protein